MSVPAPDAAFAVVLPAAGLGQRLGRATPKALVDLAGAPLLSYALGRALAAGAGSVVVAAPPGWEEHVRAACRRCAGGSCVVVVSGAARRQDSVAAALAALGPEARWVLVHDAARALAPVSTFHRVLAALHQGAAAVIPTMPVVDTLRRLGGSGRAGDVVDRSELCAVQTPQGFDRDVLVQAHVAAAEAGVQATDDAALVARLGHEVRVVEGSAFARKVTHPVDLVIAEALLATLGRSENG